MASFDDVRSRVKPRTASVRVLLGAADLPDRYEALDVELIRLTKGSDTLDAAGEIASITDQMSELQAEMDAATMEFKFKALPRSAWRKLVSEHPPSRELQKKNPRAEFAPETFIPAALAASCIDPAMTVEEAEELVGADDREGLLSEAQFNDVWICCYSVNVRSDIPKSDLASRFLRLNGASVKPPTTTESPSASSSDVL